MGKNRTDIELFQPAKGLEALQVKLSKTKYLNWVCQALDFLVIVVHKIKPELTPIPVGNVANALLISPGLEFRLSRLEDFVNLLSERIKDKQHLVPSELTEEWFDLLTLCFDGVMRSRSTSKRTRFVKIIENQIVNPKPWDEASDALRVIGDLEDDHIAMLEYAQAINKYLPVPSLINNEILLADLVIHMAYSYPAALKIFSFSPERFYVLSGGLRRHELISGNVKGNSIFLTGIADIDMCRFKDEIMRFSAYYRSLDSWIKDKNGYNGFREAEGYVFNKWIQASQDGGMQGMGLTERGAKIVDTLENAHKPGIKNINTLNAYILGGLPSQELKNAWFIFDYSNKDTQANSIPKISATPAAEWIANWIKGPDALISSRGIEDTKNERI